ncbi:hypothetical protein [Methylobacterium sp. WL120]|uniref:hypothetical protein n=1 Tax=Methylobacterium sp. WL120 TaxID=2603887 RepID=UPI0011C92DB2|nr:hypothetical protein [Methylobacterium sp. WL120]TXM62329.1 hypothetical protein FV229_22325 [Methylobacterium sp. WL120]
MQPFVTKRIVTSSALNFGLVMKPLDEVVSHREKLSLWLPTIVMSGITERMMSKLTAMPPRSLKT